MKKYRCTYLATHILLTAFSTLGDDRVTSGLEQYISPEKQTACYAFLDDWNNSDDSEKLFDMADNISRHYNLTDRLKKVNTDILLKADSLPCIDEVIIGRFMSEIGEDIIKAEEILKVVESRRTSKWYDRYSYLYDGLYYIAKMQEFHYEHITGFIMADMTTCGSLRQRPVHHGYILQTSAYCVPQEPCQHIGGRLMICSRVQS